LAPSESVLFSGVIKVARIRWTNTSMTPPTNGSHQIMGLEGLRPTEKGCLSQLVTIAIQQRKSFPAYDSTSRLIPMLLEGISL
jgi:hypothetical protein